MGGDSKHGIHLVNYRLDVELLVIKSTWLNTSHFKVIKGTSVLSDVNTVREVVLTCNLNWVYC